MLTRYAIGRPERKFIDVTSPGSAVQQAGGAIAPVYLNPIPQGTDNNARVGRKIMLTNIQMRAIIDSTIDGEVGELATDLIRILVVRDRMFTGTNTPTLADVLDETTFSSSTNLFIGFNDLRTQGKQRFTTILDKMVPVSSDTSQNYQLRIVKYFKKTRKYLEFNGTGNTAASGGRNTLWMFFFKYNTSVSAATSFVYNIRLRFTDV